MIFRNENPSLGPSTTVQELSGFGAGNPVANNYKPATRHIVNVPALVAASTSQFVFIAPWACQVLSVKATFSTASSSGTLQLVKVAQSALPVAPGTADNGTTILDQCTGTLSLAGTANTTVAGTLKGGATNVMAAGDQLSIRLGGTLTSLANCLVQVELAQIG